MEKSVDAFRTISEAAAELEVAQHVLRFWETKFKQIKPLKRGGGRRFYRPQDINLIKGIKYFLYGQGYTIKGVQKILSKKGVVFTSNVWREQNVETPIVGSSDALMGIDLSGADVDIRPTNPSPSDFANAANPISYISSPTVANASVQESVILEKNAKIKVILAELSELKQMMKSAD